MNTVIVIGRKELFSFADRHSSRRLSDYSGLADGDVLCCLFNLVFPELRIRPAAPQTHSATQRAHRNWEQLFRRFARLCIPLEFLQPAALAANSAECGFSTLVLFYFLHHLSKRADFSAEFALDVSDGVTVFLQSTGCIASLLAGGALSWSSVPPAVASHLSSHPTLCVSPEAAEAAEAAAVETYRQEFRRPRQQQQQRQRQQQSSRAGSCGSSASNISSSRSSRQSSSHATVRAGDTSEQQQEKRERVVSQAPPAQQQQRRSAATKQTMADLSSHAHQGKGSDNTSSRDDGSDEWKDREMPGNTSLSPPPRRPAQPISLSHEQKKQQPQRSQKRSSSKSSDGRRGESTPSAASSASSVSEAAGEGDVDASIRLEELYERERHGQEFESQSSQRTGSRSSSAHSVVTQSSSWRQQQRRSRDSRRSTNGAAPAAAAPAGGAPSVAVPSSELRASHQTHRTPSVASNNTSVLSARDVPAREETLQAALQEKEKECEGLQVRVAQLLSLLASVTSAPSRETARGASAGSAAALPAENVDCDSSGSPSQQQQQDAKRIRELEAELLSLRLQRSAAGVVVDAAAINNAVAALTAAIVDEETGETICVEENANLLHCLLLEHFHNAPHNRERMQRWLWAIVAAHHTVEGRLMAAVEVLQSIAQEPVRLSGAESTSFQAKRQGGRQQHSQDDVQQPQWPSLFSQPVQPTLRGSSPSTSQPRSLSTVAATFPAAAADSPSSSSPAHAFDALRSPSSPLPHAHAAADVTQLRQAFLAELEALHAREHDIRAALRAAEERSAATTQRAVRRERWWKELCAEVYAAEQSSFAITECESAAAVEAHLMARDAHYAAVEALTLKLVQDSEESERGETTTEARPSSGASQDAATPCASLEAVVNHLKEERAELLSDVSRLHALLTAVQSSPHNNPSGYGRMKGDSRGEKSQPAVSEDVNDVLPKSAPFKAFASPLPPPPAFRSLFHAPSFSGGPNDGRCPAWVAGRPAS